MEIKNKYESKLQNVALSCDSFTTGYFVMCLLLFVPFVASSDVMIIMWFLPLACIVPFAVLPLFYLLVHKVDLLLFGRYHLIMPVSAFVAALSFVMMFCDNDLGALVFIGAFLFSISITLYRYCAFSVRARLGGMGVTTHSAFSVLFSVVGALGALATYAGFLYYDPVHMYIDCAYVISGACVALAMVQYLLTYYGIPKLGGKRALTVKSVYRTFYTGLNKRLFFSSFLFQAAFACIAALLLLFTAVRGMWVYTTVFVALSLVGGYGAAQYICSKHVKYRSRALSAVILACFTVSAALLTVAATVRVNVDIFTAVVVIAAAVAGVGGAIAARQVKLRFVSIKPRVTSGVVYILTELSMLASFATAVVVASTVVTIGFFLASFICGFATALALAIVAFALTGKRNANVRHASLGLSYEPSAQDPDRPSEAPQTADRPE